MILQVKRFITMLINEEPVSSLSFFLLRNCFYVSNGHDTTFLILFLRSSFPLFIEVLCFPFNSVIAVFQLSKNFNVDDFS